MITYRESKCLIRDSKKIRLLINRHMKKNEISGKDLVEKARKNGLSFSESALSVYRRYGNAQNALSAADVLWICKNFKIRLSLDIKYFG